MAPSGSKAPPEHAGEPPTLLDHLIHVFTPLSAGRCRLTVSEPCSKRLYPSA